MQPKADTTIAAGVIEIVKTFISHPDHGVKFDEIGKLVTDVSRAFHEAALMSGVATPAPAPLAVTAEAQSEVAVAEVAPANTNHAPADAPARRRGSSKATKQDAVVAETKRGRKKKTEAPAAQDSSVEEVVASEPVVTDPLEVKFGGRIPRTTFGNMDPEAAIQNDKIFCLIDGLPRKMLHRHLLAKYNMTPEEYRAWFSLRDDYPMTAPGYSKEKSDYAKVVGLGTVGFVERTKGATAEVEAPAPEAAPAATPKTSRRERTKKPSSTKRQKTNA